MQPDNQNHKTPIDNDDASSKVSTPTALSTQSVENHHPSNHLIFSIAVIVVTVALAGAVAFIFGQINSKQAAKSDTLVVPKDWKKFTSKLFGVSFITPKEWTVDEFDPTATGTNADTIAGGGISVQAPGDTSSGYTIRISKGTLSDISRQASGNPAGAQGYSITEKSLKWQKYDALEVSIKLKNGQEETILSQLLYVQISDYVFVIPNRDAIPRSVSDGVITQATYRQFTDSIRVDYKVIEAHAKKDSQSTTGTSG